MSKTKRNALLLVSGFGLLVLVVAMSLPALTLSPGTPFSADQSRPITFESGGAPFGGDLFLWALRGLIAVTLILLPFVIAYSLFTAEGRQRLVTYIVLIALLLLVTNYLRGMSRGNAQAVQVALEQQAGARPPGTGTGTVFPATLPPAVTPLVILVASIIAATLIAVLAAFVISRRKRVAVTPDPLAVEAQKAIEAIQAGQDLKVTVINCYREMSRVLNEEKNIARGSSMTPREFEDQLVARGLPEEAIGTLTRLFEQVRYGSIAAGSDDETLAVRCLTDIVAACKTLEHAREAY